MQANFDISEAKEILGAVDWDTWIKSPGLPPVSLDFTTRQGNESSDLADEYIKLGGASSPSNYADYFDFYSNLKVMFLEQLNKRYPEATAEVLRRVDADYNVTYTPNPECKRVWYPLLIKK